MQGELNVDAGFWGGIVPDNAGQHTTLQAMVDAGVLGFKSFMIPSGAPRDSYLAPGTHPTNSLSVLLEDRALQAVLPWPHAAGLRAEAYFKIFLCSKARQQDPTKPYQLCRHQQLPKCQ